jgi:N-acetylmuramoyl-L-alanine amidase
VGNGRTMVRAVVVICFFLCAAVFAAQQSRLPSQTIGGTEYCSLWDFTRAYYPSGAWQIDGQTVRIVGRNSLELTVNSSEGFVNGMRVKFSAPVANLKGSVMVPKTDALNGLLALWSPTLPGPQSVRRSRVVIDPGHGGENTGTRGRAGVSEKKLALDIAFRVERLLEDEGIEVVLTRRKDVYVELDDRIAIANKIKADLFLSVHLNWTADSSVSGIETYLMPEAGEASMIRPSRRFDNGQSFPGNNNDRANDALARSVHRSLVTRTGAEDRGVRTSRFAVLRDAKCPAALLECGYMSNPSEERSLMTEGYRERIAQAISRGIQNFLTNRAYSASAANPRGNPAK